MDKEKKSSTVFTGSLHRKAIAPYVIKENKAKRRKTLTLLKTITDFCNSILSDKLLKQSFVDHTKEVLSTTIEALLYLEKNKTRSNIRITRFYKHLSRKQRKILDVYKVRTLFDISLISRQVLETVLEDKKPKDGMFLMILGNDSCWRPVAHLL